MVRVQSVLECLQHADHTKEVGYAAEMLFFFSKLVTFEIHCNHHSHSELTAASISCQKINYWELNNHFLQSARAVWYFKKDFRVECVSLSPKHTVCTQHRCFSTTLCFSSPDGLWSLIRNWHPKKNERRQVNAHWILRSLSASNYDLRRF